MLEHVDAAEAFLAELVRVTEAAEPVKLASPGGEFWRPLLVLLLLALHPLLCLCRRL